MRYWWANQSSRATYRQEIAGGYLWSPRHRSDGSRNPFYDNLRLAQPGDMVFAFHASAVRAVGIIVEAAIESPSPEILPPPKDGERSQNPDIPGWLLNIAWLELKEPFRPARHMAVIEPLLPSAHSPLSPAGRGLQGGRLLELRQHLAIPLLQLVGGRNPDKLIRPPSRPGQMRFQFDAPDEGTGL